MRRSFYKNDPGTYPQLFSFVDLSQKEYRIPSYGMTNCGHHAERFARPTPKEENN